MGSCDSSLTEIQLQKAVIFPSTEHVHCCSIISVMKVTECFLRLWKVDENHSNRPFSEWFLSSLKHPGLLSSLKASAAAYVASRREWSYPLWSCNFCLAPVNVKVSTHNLFMWEKGEVWWTFFPVATVAGCCCTCCTMFPACCGMLFCLMLPCLHVVQYCGGCCSACCTMLSCLLWDVSACCTMLFLPVSVVSSLLHLQHCCTALRLLVASS